MVKQAALNPAKLYLIDNVVQQKCRLGEFAAIRSGIREVLANQCKYLHLKPAPKDSGVI